MKIDITGAPPADIFRDRGKHLRISIALLFLVVCGLLLMVYGIVSDVPQSDTLESAALTLFVVPAVIFAYFGVKLNAYKGLSLSQRQELIDLGRKYPEISTYCTLVARQGREPVFAEYEACKDWEEDVTHKQAQEKRSGRK